MVPVEEMFPYWAFPIYGQPTCLAETAGRTRTGSILVKRHEEMIGDLSRCQRILRDHNADTVDLKSKLRGHFLPRFLAKIAYGFAVEEFGVEPLLNSAYVLPAILDDSSDIGKWVGNTDSLSPQQQCLHMIRLAIEDGNICAFIVLFGNRAPVPEYQVVVGPAPQAQSAEIEAEFIVA